MADYDLIIAGTGFAASFFLHRYLQHAPKNARVLVLERGERVEQHRPGPFASKHRLSEKRHTINRNPEKEWHFSVGFGGGSNCWWACTPRLLPNDFRIKTTYGVGRDWPLSYDDLETFYCDAEELLAVAGDSHDSPTPRSRPYPQPPHRFNGPDLAFKRAYPDAYFPQPSARPTASTASGRPACCNNGVCSSCPIDSKYTIRREMGSCYADPRVSLLTGARLDLVTTRSNVVTGVEYDHRGVEKKASSDFVALGTNAIFNPFTLLRSGISDAWVGKRLHEQRSVMCSVDLRDVDNFQGSTSVTGNGYMFYDGLHRRNHAACLIENHNYPAIRLTPGKWRKRMSLKFIFEDLPRERNRVVFDERQPDKPVITYAGQSSYAKRGMDRVGEYLKVLGEVIAIERVNSIQAHGSESHILGTALMGNDSKTSVVDRSQLHHRYRNLAVLGGSSFPTSSPSNPTLTICALSLWSAGQIFGRSNAAS